MLPSDTAGLARAILLLNPQRVGNSHSQYTRRCTLSSILIIISRTRQRSTSHRILRTAHCLHQFSFGFDALGLALYAKNDTHYLGEARQFWNFYYTRYSDDVVAYPRAIDVFSLAGFKIYGCNKTVEDFTRKFLTNSYGSSIEEFGLDAAAAYQLKNCTVPLLIQFFTRVL